MGMVMQVLMIAVQNSVDYEHLGVATSGTTLFRSVGGALGVALFGAIFANGLHAQLGGSCRLDSAIPSRMPAAVRGAAARASHQQYITAVMAALRPVFLVAAGVAALGFALTCAAARDPAARRRAARRHGREPSPCRATPPRWKSSSASCTVLMAHENRWRVYADLAERASSTCRRRSCGCWRGSASASR